MHWLIVIVALLVGAISTLALIGTPSHLPKIELVVTVATLAAVLTSIVIGLQQVETTRRAEQTQNLGRLTEAMGGGHRQRVMGLYGLGEYTGTYRATRSEVLLQLAAHARYLSRSLAATPGDKDALDELRVTLRVLGRSSARDGADEQVLAYDLANVHLRSTPMPDLVAESAYFVQTGFTDGDLSNSRWTCVNASGADLTRTRLTDAQFVAVNLTDADFTGSDVTSMTFTDVYWDEGREPRWEWPDDSPAPGNSPRLNSRDCQQKYKLGDQ